MMGVDELTGYLMLFVGETKKLMKLRQNEKALELARRSADMMHEAQAEFPYWRYKEDLWPIFAEVHFLRGTLIFQHSNNLSGPLEEVTNLAICDFTMALFYRKHAYPQALLIRSLAHQRLGSHARRVRDILHLVTLKTSKHEERLATMSGKRILKYEFGNSVLQGAWRKCAVSGDIPGGRAFCAHTQVGHMLYIYGGTYANSCGKLGTAKNSVQFYNDLYAFNLETFNWRKLKASGPMPEACTKAVMWYYQGCLYIHGGMTYDPAGGQSVVTLGKTLWRYDLTNQLWSKVVTKNSVSCCGHNGFVVGDEFYMAGGATGSLEERKRKCWSPCHVHQLDLQQLKWTKFAGKPCPEMCHIPDTRHQFACWFNRERYQLYMFGGQVSQRSECRAGPTPEDSTSHFDLVHLMWHQDRHCVHDHSAGIRPFPVRELASTTNQQSLDSHKEPEGEEFKAFVFGGCTDLQADFRVDSKGIPTRLLKMYNNDLHMYSNGKWFYVENTGEVPRKRAGACMAYWKGNVYVLLGYTTLSRDELTSGQTADYFNTAFMCSVTDRPFKDKVCAYSKCNVTTYRKALQKCGRCMKFYYCSRECQKSDWEEHKAACVPKTEKKRPQPGKKKASK